MDRVMQFHQLFWILAAAGAAGCSSAPTTDPASDAAPGSCNSGHGEGGAPDAGGDGGAVADGGLMDEDAPSGFAFAPSNVKTSSFPDGVGDVTINGSSCVIDTDKLTIDCISPASDGGLPYVFVSAKQGDGSSVGLLAAGSLSIPASSQLILKGSVPLVVWARGAVDIQGSLVADPAFRELNGGGAVQTASGAGGGAGGGAAASDTAYVAGGGGGYCGAGGTGANSVVDAGGAQGGGAYGNATLTPLVGGASGGGEGAGLEGGEGGGAIEIVAGQSILVGTGGIVTVPGRGATGNGGGGGSGGAILLEAPEVTVNGVLAANGGGAGVFSGGGGAQDGQPSAVPARGQTASSAVGSAGTQIRGADGTSTSNNATSGGGGGAGRIRINTTSGAATIGSQATVSPAQTTSCVTQGKLGT
jgi:hypothetical protein